MKYLFIGGIKDGQRIRTDGQLHYEFIKNPPSPVETLLKGIPVWEKEIYERVALTQTHTVYCLPGMSSNSILSRLIDGYGVDLAKTNTPASD